MKRTKSKKKKEIEVELIPVYIPKEEFEEHKREVQDLLAKILIEAHKADLEEERKETGSTPPRC